MIRWPRRRDRWEWAILGGTALAIGATILVAFTAVRSRRQVHHAALASLTNYLAIALDRYANGVETSMRQSFVPILPPPDYVAVNQRDPLPLADLAEMVEQQQKDPCQCMIRPGASGFFRLGLSTGDDAFSDSLGAPRGATDSLIAAAVRAQADSLQTSGMRYGFVAGATGAGDQFLFFTLRTDPSSARRFAYGMAVPVETVGQRILAQAFATTRLVPRHLLSAVPRNEDFVSLEAATRTGGIIYTSGPAFRDGATEALNLPTLRGGMVLRAWLNPALKGLLIPGGVPPRVPVRELTLMALSLVLWVMIAVLALRAADLARLRTDFASSVTHELRTPLTQIRLAAETMLLGRSRDKDSERRALASIVDETGRLQQLIDNVLHWSRAERRLTTVAAQPLALRVFATDVVAGFAPLVAPHRMSIQVTIPEDLVVAADPDALRQILLNLLDNASRYGPDDQVIGLRGAVAGSHVDIAVEDEGPGIAAADRERVWRPFVRLEHEGSVTGSGLGLAVVRELVEAHQGRCRIEGREGRGTRVVVSLPIGVVG